MHSIQTLAQVDNRGSAGDPTSVIVMKTRTLLVCMVGLSSCTVFGEPLAPQHLRRTAAYFEALTGDWSWSLLDEVQAPEDYTPENFSSDLSSMKSAELDLSLSLGSYSD